MLPKFPLQIFGVTDCLLKIGFGLWMMLLYPAFGMA